MSRFIACVAVFVFAAVSVAQENESERILSFQSEVTVNTDATLLVRETIRVYVLNQDINHGIYRDFPTNYKASWLTRFTTTFEMQEALLDGVPVPYHQAAQSNGVRTYLGDPNSYVSRGEHTYTITYRTRHQIAYWKDTDEVYWNVTGNGWTFPIESAEARVHLPSVIDSGQLELNGYTGPQGSTEKACESSHDANGDVVFRTTRSLQAEEGFTISVIFPKGHITRPSISDDLKKWAADNRAIRITLFGSFATVAYFIFAWFLVGRDPAPGEFRARSEPPKDYSPATMRYLTQMGFDNQTFATALVSLAVKKAVEISQGDKYFTVDRLASGDADITPEEQAVLKTLFNGYGDSIIFKQSNHARIAKAIQACHDSLRTRYETKYFLSNVSYALPGTCLAMATIAAAVYLSPHKADAPLLFLCIWLTIWTFGCLVLLFAVVSSWRFAFKGVAQLGGAVFITAFATPFFAAEIFVMAMLFGSNAAWVLPLIVVLAGINWFFYHLMKSPTKLGRRALDEIDGFRAYLEGGRRLPNSAVMTTPEATEFNAYFPYAMALDLDKEWAERFTSEITNAEKDDPRYNAYRPYWYRGNMWERRGMSGFSGAIAGAMAAEIASSSTAPGKSSGGSSGGGGGGSSGGGGGGGGGGGW
ncbi:MAG: DUF2207 domain-containing protein [Candidatus Hydrogenedentes bacterium]|nr:DUF2207 domain-containing protein [Candidatus Hydrogenedentota bacterium]